MDDLRQRQERFDQIEKQVSVGLPPSGPQIISEETVDTNKTTLLNMLAVFGIIIFGIISFMFLFPKKSKPTITQVANISPTPEEQSVVSLNTQYANPFDTSTQYTNPFSQNTNPFTTLSQ